MKRIAIIVSFIVFIVNAVFCQQYAPNFTINQPVTSSQTYVASEFVKYTNGASFKGAIGKEMVAKIDPYMVFPPTTGITGGPNANDNGVVGAIEGQGSVGSMGNFIYTIPLQLPECVPGMTPSLSLVYNSAGGDGYLGHGWALGGMSSITRVPSNLYYDGIVDPVDFDGLDRLALDGSRLIAVNGNYWDGTAEYRFESENGMKVLPHGEGFKVYSPDGKISYYGESDNSRIWKPNTTQYVQWFLSRVIDVYGNTIKYEYDHNNGLNGIFTVVPTKIAYNYNTSVSGFADAVYNVRFYYLNLIGNQAVAYSCGIGYCNDKLLQYIAINKGTTEIEHYNIQHSNPFLIEKQAIESITLYTPDNVRSFNPTQLLYTTSNSPIELTRTIQNFGIVGTNANDSLEYYSGDFNGDGYTDLLQIRKFRDPVAVRGEPDIIGGWRVLINDQTGNFNFIAASVNPNNTIGGLNKWTIHDGVTHVIVGNFNGDNRSDIAFIHDYDIKDLYRDRNDYVALNKIEVCLADQINCEFITSFFNSIPINKYITEVINSDFTGDGIDDLFFNTSEINTGSHPYFINTITKQQFCLSTNYANLTNSFSLVYTSSGGTSYNDNQFNDIQIVNFDSDSKMEILKNNIVSNNNAEILSFNTQTNQFDVLSNGVPFEAKYQYKGDFNGDGLTDILGFVPSLSNNGIYGSWSVAYCTGIGFSPLVAVPLLLNRNPTHFFQDIGLVKYYIGDFNADGYDDVLENFINNPATSQSSTTFRLYYSTGAIESFTMKEIVETGFEAPVNIRRNKSYFIDINGDGQQDLITPSEGYWYTDPYTGFIIPVPNPPSYFGRLFVYSFSPFQAEGLLTDVTDGLSHSHHIDYSIGKSSLVYTSGENTFNSTLNKVIASSCPIYVVNSLWKKIQPSVYSKDSYRYFNGLFSTKGKGFLGYEKILVTNNVTGLNSITKNKLYTNNTSTYDFVIAVPDFQLMYLNSELNYLSKANSETAIEVLNGKRYRVTQSKQLSKSFDLDLTYYKGTTLNIINFDTYCQPTLRKTLVSTTNLEMISSEDLFEHRSETSTIYKTPDLTKWIFNRPETVTSTVYYKSPGNSVFASKTNHSKYTYYNSSESGYPMVKETMSYSDLETDKMAVKKAFEYNALGMIKKETLSAPNHVPPTGLPALGQRVIETIYDPTLPYLPVSTKDPKGFVTQYSYDPFGLYIATTTDINGLITKSEKDILGVQSKTIYPEGTTQITCKRWSKGSFGEHPDNPPGGLYYIWSKTTGTAEMLTFYNSLGQELRLVAYDQNGEKLYSDKSYDTRGRLLTETTPYKPFIVGDLSNITTTYTYDLLNRVIATTSKRGTATVEYKGFETIYTDILGKKSTRYINAAGWMTESKDNIQASVKYLHDCSGKVVKTYHSIRPNETAIINEYDSHGNCIKLIDPAAGTIEFLYDPFDQMITRKDSRQTIPTKYIYDVLGRTLSRIETEGTTSWTYDNKPNGLGMPGSVTFIDHNTQYSYDNLSRVKEVTNQIKGINYTNKVAYDAYGRVNKKEYPTSLIILTEYTSSGNEGKLYQGGDNPVLIWKSGSTDNYGRLNKSKYGNGATTEFEYEADRGLLTKQWVKNQSNQEFFRREYNWEHDGNLNWRSKNSGIATLTESFTYDNLNRLTGASLNNATTESLYYCPVGNILSKYNQQGTVFEDAQYGEINQNPYAITSADVNNDLWPPNTQNITYNSYNKMTLVTEGNHQLEISYGYDHQRTYQELKQNNTVITKKTFVGDGLEIIEKPGSGMIQKIHYISGANGLFGMYVIDQNNIGKMYYLYTDHLGSPNLITDSQCNAVEELSFDAWGNRRNPVNWQPFSIETGIPESFIDRGFTFHEHLYPFTLINMNGRAYDPLVGRFLSPDPYIQAPDNTQNLNRYSYCLNNPLKYTDPSGEIIFTIIGAIFAPVTGGASLALGIAMDVGGAMNLGIKASQGKINSFGDGLAAYGIGAAAGAVGYATGGAAFAAAGGAAGGAGGFLAGFAGGAIGSAYAMPIQSIGNTLYFGDPMMTPGQYALGILGGGVLGGSIQGISALANGKTFWNGTVRPSNIGTPTPRLALKYASQNTKLNTDGMRSQLKSIPQDNLIQLEDASSQLNLVKVNTGAENYSYYPSTGKNGSFVSAPNGQNIKIPANYYQTPANNGNGIVFRPIGTSPASNANAIRIMGSTSYAPNGYAVFYNSLGQPINPITGQTLPRSLMHFKF